MATDLLLKALPAPSYSTKQAPVQLPPRPPRRQGSLDRSCSNSTSDQLLPRRARMTNKGKVRLKKRHLTPDSRGTPPDELDGNKSGGRTVFYSLRQTGSLLECGLAVPGAPPATPLPAELPPGQKYVLSLQDTRSKRELSVRLAEMKEKLKDAAKQSELKAQSEEREREQERIARLRVDQRNRIYALNQLMTELEFRDFQVYRASRSDS